MTAIYNIKYAIFAFAVAMLCASCAEIDLCEDTHEDMPTVQYSFNFGNPAANANWGDNAAHAPEQMYVMAHRIVNDWKRVDRVPVSEETDTFGVRPGEYKFLALPTKHNAFDLTEMVRCLSQHVIYGYGYEDFRHDESYGRVQDKSISYKRYTKQQILGLSDDDASGDDKVARYIHPYAEPFFFDSVSVVDIKSGNKLLKFAPKPITQHISLEFSLERAANDQATEVDSVHAEISGIPVAMGIGTRYVSADATVSAFFPLQTSWKEVDGARILNCKGGMNVTTILDSEDASDLNGNGVLTVTIFTSRKKDNCEKETDRLVVKRNLKGIIKESGLYVYAEDNESIVRNAESAAIVLTTPFRYGK